MSVRSPVDSGTVVIIIPQYNQPALTIQAIQSLRQVDPVRWPILVVDNGSSHESVRQLHDLCDSNVQVLSLPQAGLTSAWNAAVQHVRADHLIFLNNDTTSGGPWVESLLAPLRHGLAFVTGVALRRESQLDPPVDLPAGWCFAVRRETFESVRGFDAALQLYFSDTDFLIRVRDYCASVTTPAWAVVAGLSISHIAHATAHRLPHQRALWLADRERFLIRWQEPR